LIITIDGPAGSGKSTLAINLAKKYGMLYLDTGATYRAIALAAKIKGLDESQPTALASLAETSEVGFTGDVDNMRVILNGKDVTEQIRTAEIGELASRISTIPQVRRALVALQRRIVEGKDVVSDGRDTGTVVFPNADLKIYLDASIEERAKRRAVDWAGEVDLEKVKYEVARRDDRDRTRSDSPLRVAEGAIIIDTTTTQPEDVVETTVRAMHKKGLIPQD
jgi:cytidylate kinase